MEPSPLGIMVLAFLLGMGHALEADHVMAVSTVLSEHRSLVRSSLVGICWDPGHTATLFLVGLLVIFFKVRIPERLALSMEFAVRIVLVPGMKTQIAPTAWSYLDAFDEFDEPRILRFTETHRGIDHHPRCGAF